MYYLRNIVPLPVLTNHFQGPNDESANDGQDLTHAIYTMTLGSLHFAPVSMPKQVLDIGTGTGIWAIEMGDEHPDAQILGTDLSPIQPELVPPNCIFEIDDCEMEWTWPDNHFDYIHIRDLHGSIRDWSKFMKEAFRCCKPGGLVELVHHNFWPVSAKVFIAFVLPFAFKSVPPLVVESESTPD